MTSSFVSEEFLSAFRLLDPVTKRRRYVTSRLAVMTDGTTVPVLRLLARERFGEWDEKAFFPFWTDGDWRNETFVNVELCAVGKERELSAYGVPAGTKEYFQRYREANRDKVQSAQRTYRRKRQEAFRSVKAALSALPESPAPAPVVIDPDEPSILKELERLVEPNKTQP